MENVVRHQILKMNENNQNKTKEDKKEVLSPENSKEGDDYIK